MGVRFLGDDENVAMYDSVTGTAFGPVIGGPGAEEKAEAFSGWIADGSAATAWVGMGLSAAGIWHGSSTEIRSWTESALATLYQLWIEGHVDDDGYLILEVTDKEVGL